MKKYKKKPIAIEAVQLIESNNLLEISKWCGFGVSRTIGNKNVYSKKWIEIETLEGVMRANYKDWIIKGVSGEFYSCKPEIFKATYEEVEI